MGRKAILEKRLQRLQAKKQKLKERALASQDAAEVRSINEQLEDVNAEIGETEEEIRAIDGEGGEPAPFNDPDDPVNDPAAAPQQRGLAPVPGAGDPVGTTVVRGAYGPARFLHYCNRQQLCGQPCEACGRHQRLRRRGRAGIPVRQHRRYENQGAGRDPPGGPRPSG